MANQMTPGRLLAITLRRLIPRPRNVKVTSTKHFSRDDMLRFGRYIDNGRDTDVIGMFDSWFQGPDESGRKPVVWVERKARARVKRI